MPDAELSVLYVDDEVILLEITKLYLTSLGFLVETSDSGSRALEMIDNTRYDAIISDYQMPGMDGITLLKEIRSRYPNLPFILFTGRGREDVVIEAIECGADFYLQKGGSPKPQFAELVHKIHRSVQLRREEIALIESEARFNQVAESAGEWIWETDKDGHYIYCSSAVQTILGYQPEELIGIKHFFDLFESGTRDAQTSQVQIMMKEHRSVKGVIGVYQHKNGEKVILQSSGSAIFNVAGDLIGFRGIHQDVTEQKRNEAIIRLNEKRLSRAQEIGKSGNWEFEIKTGLLWGSENAIRMFGYHRPAGTITVEEIESRIVERDRVHQALVDLVTQGKEYHIEYTVIPADNSPHKTILSIASIEPDEHGAGSKVIGVILDITERKRSEDEIRRMSEEISAAYEELISNEEELRTNYQALAQSEKHYRILAENLKDVVWILDTETNQFRYVSPSVLQLRGYTTEEVIAKPVDDALTSENAAEIKELIKKRAEQYRAGKGEPYYTNLIEQPCKDGTTIWTEVISSYYTNEETGTVDLRGVTRDITERIAAEKALERSEERYRTLMQILPVSLCLVHNHTEINFCNDRFTKMLGYTQEDIPTIHDWWKKAYPDEIYRSQVIHEWENNLNEAGIQKSDIKPREYQICKKDGNFRTIEISGILLDDDYLVTMLDVTERKRAEHALMESEAKFRSLIENSLESILIVDLQGNLLFANRAAYRMVEADQGRPITQMNVMEFIDPVSREEVARDFAEVMSGHDSYLARYHVITSKGNHIQVESIGKRITYENEPAIILSVSDVTIRRKAEEALAESQDKYQQLFELGSEAIFLIDNETGNILEANWAASEMYGYSHEELLKLQNRDLSAEPEETREVTTKTPLGSIVIPLRIHRKKSGEIFRVEITGRFFTWKDRGVHVAAIRDITERKRVEDALIQANRQLNLLSDVTRHDILNMISVIFGYLDVAEEESISPVMGECLRKINHSIRTIQSEIEFTRLYQNLGTSEPGWINIKKLLPCRQVPQDVTFMVEIPDLSIHADPMLEKVFYNLLDNSIRHGIHVTRVTLSETPEESGIVLIYEDNGVGIPINEKEKVFERGYGKNSGLGLFLVREILSITGITILENGIPGAGARFEIHIPKGAFRVL